LSRKVRANSDYISSRLPAKKKTKKIIIIKYSVEVKVSFIDFLPLTNKDAESPTDIILSQITADGLYIQDCRG